MSKLLHISEPEIFCYRHSRTITRQQFMFDVYLVSHKLPKLPIINVCKNRYNFAVVFCAAILNGDYNILPPNYRSIDDMRLKYHATSVDDDSWVLYNTIGTHEKGTSITAHVPTIPDDRLAAISFSSGSTGEPVEHKKTWGELRNSTLMNARATRGAIRGDINIVSTMPLNHFFGVIMGVLQPLFTKDIMTNIQPFFPEEIAAELKKVPEPRMLVTTTKHLEVLVNSEIPLPEINKICIGAAPLSTPLAKEAEYRYNCPVIEVLGAVEVLALATRRTAMQHYWTLMDEVNIESDSKGTLVYLYGKQEPTFISDITVPISMNRFELIGRNNDIIKVAGKRASLADLTQRLLNVPGVEDAALYQHQEDRRLTAVVVGRPPALTACLLRDGWPVALPRPVYSVEALPRNEAGKLPREALAGLVEHLDKERKA